MCASITVAALFSMSTQFFSKKLWRKNFTSVEIHLVSIFSMQVQNLSLQTYCLFHAIPKAWSPTNIHKGPFSFCLSFLDVWRFLCDQGFFCPEATDLSIPPEGDSPIHVLVQSGTCKKFKPPEMVMMTFFCSMMRALLIGRQQEKFYSSFSGKSSWICLALLKTRII